MLHRDPRTFQLNDFGRLAVAHAASVVGDALLTVSLAGSIFFTQDIARSRTQVLLYLVLTIAPFAVVAPVIGPALDRSRAGRRTLMAVGLFARALVCLLMAGNLESLLLYPLAFAALVLAKGHAVAKSALVPTVVGDEARLVDANSRLALISVVASVAGGAPGAAIIAIAGAPWSLRLASVVFVLGGFLALRVPRSDAEVPVDAPTSVEAELHLPSIVYAGTAMAVLRGTVGFLTFFLAFHLKKVGEPAWFYGLALASGSLGGFLGVVVSPLARRRVREETMLSAALLVAAAVALLCARSGGRPATLVIALTIAVAAQFGRIAFDSLLQRDGPEHLRGRNFARFETRFQLVWVAGALIPVALLDVLTTREGYLTLGVVLASAGVTYALSLRSLAAGAGRSGGEAVGAPDGDDPR
ncbi:MAG: MFS transporter [Actinomycetes bacterium]